MFGNERAQPPKEQSAMFSRVFLAVTGAILLSKECEKVEILLFAAKVLFWLTNDGDTFWYRRRNHLITRVAKAIVISLRLSMSSWRRIPQ
jgi:hypothetical protein